MHNLGFHPDASELLKFYPYPILFGSIAKWGLSIQKIAQRSKCLAWGFVGVQDYQGFDFLGSDAALDFLKEGGGKDGDSSVPSGDDTVVISERSHAYKALKDISGFLKDLDPHSPTPYLVELVSTWEGKTLIQILTEIEQGKNEAHRILKLMAHIANTAAAQDADHASLDELKGVIDLHKGPGQDVAHERAMLKSILDLGSVQVGEIMVHRKNVTMLNADEPLSIIVDQGDPDNIIGIINAKALLRAPWFVPESTDLLDQLQAFRQRREHFSLVVDEYGVLMGIVTLEDILEEIVGDIADEHDITVRGVRPQVDGSYVVDGSVTIRDLNRQFDWNLPDEPAATVAGLLLYQVRMIPQ
eukprot:gene17980-18216_t